MSWRSAKALFDAGEIRAPEGLRSLIETVEGRAPLPLPEALQQAEFRHEGRDIIERGMVRNVLINAMEPFDQDAMLTVGDDEVFPTRFEGMEVPQNGPEIAAVKAGWPDARARHTMITVLYEAGRICEGLRNDRNFGVVSNT